ncbi:MAG: ribosome silencing factor [Phycisphaerales bacterium]|nr:ribosome silencing factor [Phycisphaerales bacterium]
MNTHEESNQPETNDQSSEQSTDQNSDQPMAGATMSEGSKLLNVEDARKFALLAAQSLGDDKCTDVVVIDVGGRSPLTGFLVIGSGTSARQMRGALGSLEVLAEECGTSVFHITEDDSATWLLADFVDVVVHLFEPNARAHYDLEGLWFEGERLEVPPSAGARNRSSMPGRTVIRKSDEDAQ